MHPHLKSMLVKAGCDPKATDDEAQQFYDGMSAEKKAEIDGGLARLMDGGGDGDGDTAGASARPRPQPAGEPTASGAGAGLSARQIAEIASQAALAAVAAMTGGGDSSRPVAGAARRNGGGGGGGGAQHQQPAQQQDDDDDAALDLETKRVERIKKLAGLHKLDDGFVDTVVAECGTFEAARVRILKEVAANAKPLNSVKVGDDKQVAALRVAIPQAMILRAGLGEGDDEKTKRIFAKLGEPLHEQARKLAGQSMLDMFRTYLVGLGVDPMSVFSMSRATMAATLGPRALRAKFPRIAALAESTSDFGNITLDAINKALRFNYLDAKRTWPIWAERKFAPDFKTINSIALSEAPSMVSADEGAELVYVSLSDSKETARLKTYKAGIKLTRNAIINDDMDAFNAIPRLQANAAARLEDDTAYALITANAAMADAGLLFNATVATTAGGHANLTASGGAPSVANLQVGATSMKKQKGLKNVARLELQPKYLLVPSSIEESTKELLGSDTLIASQSSSGSAPTTVGNKNPFFNRYQVVGSVRLDDASTTAWYLVADFRDGQIGTFQLYFLTDEPEPVLRQETDFDTEDVKYLVRHTVAGLVPDFRGAYKNAGA